MTNAHLPDESPVCDAKAARLFWIFAGLHGVVWTFLPYLTQPNGPLDTMEMLYWGHEWQAGYYKHPPFPAWLAEISVRLFGKKIWPTYMLSQICTLACFWSAFTVAKNCIGARKALLSVLVLEGCYYFHYTTPEFNNNVVSRALWGVTIAFLFFGVVRHQLWGWTVAGVTLGLGMLSKYDTSILAMTMCLFSILHPLGRSSWKTLGPWITLGISVAIFTPHLIWMFHNDFPTIRYFLQRSSSEGTLYDHLRYSFGFLSEQAGAFLPICVFVWLLIGRDWRLRKIESFKSAQERDFVLSFVLAPIFLIMLVGLMTGVRIQSMWGASLWTYTGVAIFVCIQVPSDPANIWRACRFAASLGLLAVGALLFHDQVLPSITMRHSRVHFPGYDLAVEVEQAFRRETGGSPAIVGGPWWPAANVAFYMKERSSVYADLNPIISPWLCDDKFRDQGGVIVLPNEMCDEKWPQSLVKRFPDIIEVSPVEVRPKFSLNAPIMTFRVLIVPPSKR